MKIKGFKTHKLAEKDSDCQDYFDINIEKKKVAISDGMSQSIFQYKWAEILVQYYLNLDITEDKLPTDLQILQDEWLKYAKEELKLQEKQGIPTWMLENCLSERQGAGATFCGISFKGFQWSGQVLGDSCLIEVDANDEIIEIHSSQEGEFGNHPDFFDSFNDGKGNPKDISGKLLENYKLLLVTDPFAEFLYLKRKEKQEQKYIKQLVNVNTDEEFCRLVKGWRDNEKMHNDDSTLIVIEYDGNDEFIYSKLNKSQQEEEHKPEYGMVDAYPQTNSHE